MVDLRAYIRDPVNVSSVCHSKLGWQDKATTLGNLKSLGKGLEISAQEHTENLRASLGKE